VKFSHLNRRQFIGGPMRIPLFGPLAVRFAVNEFD